MKIGFFEVDNKEKEYFQDKFPEHELYFFDFSLNKADNKFLNEVDIVITFINSKIDDSTLSGLSKLKYISTMSTGFDHIDLEACKKRNILVSNVPTYAEITVAEHTFALMLALARRLAESYERVRSGIFSPTGLTGFELSGKTLGVIGIGNIGKSVIKMAECFSMKVLGFSRHQDEKLEKELNFNFVSLDVLLSSSDIISLHLPYNDQTHHFLNKEKFDKMKNGVVIINTARGQIIDTSALLTALMAGKIGGAGLDVLEGEPLLKEEKELLSKEFNKEDLLNVLEDKMLISDSRIIITPHNAFNSKESLERLLGSTVANIKSFIAGSPQNLVNK